MPAWTGGACPECGVDMPPLLVRCANCRALLNHDLEPELIELPEFVPLPEVEAVIDVHPAGYFIGCPHCRRELRINSKYVGKNVQCKFCQRPFDFRLEPSGPECKAFYSTCPHCTREIRAAQKYMGAKVACKHCQGAIHFVEAVPI